MSTSRMSHHNSHRNNASLVGFEGRIVEVDHEKVTLTDIAIGVIIGRTSEYFNFFVFGIAAVIAFPEVFFPFASAQLGTIYSFVIFSLAFVARPLGTILFDFMHKRYGRGTKLTIALFAMGTVTVVIALLPSYATLGGWAIVLLVLFRIGQGIAEAGSWDGLPSLLALSAPKGKRGWYAMIPQLSAPLGFIIAAGLFAFLVSELSHADFVDWGWRYPFFVAFALNVVALFARMRLVVAPNFIREMDEYELDPVSKRRLFSQHGMTIFQGAIAPLVCYALFNLVTIFALSWAALFTSQSLTQFLMVQVIGGVIALVTMLISGKMADLLGRRRSLGIMAVCIAIFSGWSAVLLEGSNLGGYIFVLVGFALLGLSHAQAAGSLNFGFPRAYRFSGAAFTADFNWLFGAAFAPLLALLLAIHLGVDYVGLYLLSGAIGTYAVLRANQYFQNTEGAQAKEDMNAE